MLKGSSKNDSELGVSFARANAFADTTECAKVECSESRGTNGIRTDAAVGGRWSDGSYLSVFHLLPPPSVFLSLLPAEFSIQNAMKDPRKVVCALCRLGKVFTDSRKEILRGLFRFRITWVKVLQSTIVTIRSDWSDFAKPPKYSTTSPRCLIRQTWSCSVA